MTLTLHTYAVASKYSRYQFISEKYETTQLFKPHFPQNSPLVEIYTSASDWECVGDIPGNQFVEAFSARTSHS